MQLSPDTTKRGIQKQHFRCFFLGTEAFVRAVYKAISYIKFVRSNMQVEKLYTKLIERKRCLR
jgi:hypothetical protein